jgi:glycosyltransferase involved in cell wall biosynthesis
MRIGFDTHFISRAPATGNHTYTAELVQALISMDSQNEYVLYAVQDHPYYHQFRGNSRVRIRYVLPLNGLARNFVWLPWVVAQDKLDVLHLHFILPWFIHVPTVLAVHDLFYLHVTHPALSEKVLGQLTIWSAQRANHIVTLSEYSQQDIISQCSVNDSGVTAIPLAAHPRFSPIQSNTAISAIKEHLGIQRDYILFVGRTEDPRKNVLTLVDAYAQLIAQGNITAQLVVAGRHGPGTAKIKQRIQDLGLENNVLLPGIVPDDDLPVLLSGAKVFVYVSSFEGFGLPVLEAMACGTPTITSNVTSLPEVAGNAALMVKPGDVEELTQALRQVLNDPLLHRQMSERGLAQARQFTWERAARATLAVYQNAVRSH